MWFLYGLSWLSLLLQVAFVTLAIGERRRGGAGGGGEASRAVGPLWGGEGGEGGTGSGAGSSEARGTLGVTWGALRGSG